MGEINDTRSVLRGGNSFTNGRCGYTVMHKFCDETALARAASKEARIGIFAIAWKPSWSLQICTLWAVNIRCAPRENGERTLERRADAPLLSRASIPDDVLRANAPLYLVRNGPVIVIRTHPRLARYSRERKSPAAAIRYEMFRERHYPPLYRAFRRNRS